MATFSGASKDVLKLLRRLVSLSFWFLGDREKNFKGHPFVRMMVNKKKLTPLLAYLLKAIAQGGLM